MTRFLALVVTCALSGLTIAAQSNLPANANRLTAEEQSAGWRLLFDGHTTKGWRGFAKAPGVINGWIVDSGRLRHPASTGQDSKGNGDIITIDTFNDFDLRFEWMISAGGNSGVKYLVVENREGGPIAHEYQVIDDAKHPDALIGPHRATGALYDVIAAPASKPLKPAGQINSGRVLVSGNHVEHWLNGVKIVEYELGSALKAAKEKSKFKDVPGWEDKLKGHILLQDHGDDVSFFNIKIRELPATTRQ